MNDNEFSLSELVTDESKNEGETLICTFYFYNGDGPFANSQAVYLTALDEVIVEYCRNNNIPLNTSGQAHGWLADKYQSFHHFFVTVIPALPGLPDTTAVLIGATTYIGISAGWPTLTKAMEVLLEPWREKVLYGTAANGYKFLGCSQLYTCNLQVGTSLNKKPGTFQNYLHPLYTDRQLQQLSAQQLEGGKLFLLNLPLKVGFNDPIVYLMAGETGKINPLIYQSFYEASSSFLAINGYLLKSVYEWSQLRSDSFQKFKDRLKHLSESVELLISQILKQDNPDDIFKTFKTVSATYHDLLGAHSRHERLALSISIQRQNLAENLRNTTIVTENNRLVDYLANHIRIQEADSQAINERSQLIFKQAENAISLAESYQTNFNNKRIFDVQTILTLLGVGLAFIQIFDNDCAIGLLRLLHIIDNQQADPGWWVKLVTKLVIGGLVLVLTYLLKPKLSDHHAKTPA